MTQVSEFGNILIYIIVGIIFLSGGLLSSRILRPKRPNEEKLTSYECGEDPVGGSWGNFNPRFYIIAIIFLLFDVEIVLLFPWATVFADWGWIGLIEAFVFIGILSLGLVYAWAKGHLEWVKPSPKKSDFKGVVPTELYDNIKMTKEGQK